MTLSGVVVEDHGVSAALLALASRLGDLSDPLTQLGRDAVDDAHPYVPVDTGALLGDFGFTATADQLLVQAGQVVDYAAPQNSGVPSHNIPATHFFDRAETFVEEHVEYDVERAVQQLIHSTGL